MFNTSKVVVSMILALVMAGGVMVTPAFASHQTDCEGLDGVWVGTTAEIGSCYWAPDHEFFIDEPCDPAIHESLYITWDGPFFVEQACLLITSSSASSGGASGSEGRETNETNDETTTLSLGGSNGSVTFPAGTCGQKCTITSSLPGPAKNSLPGGAIATLYVRVVDEGGVPGTGS